MHKILLGLFLFAWQVTEDNCFENGDRIYGGFYVNIERAPYYVQIIRSGKSQCGGSILRPEVVLTAGHCVFKKYQHLTILVDSKELQVIAGSDRKLHGTRIDIKSYFLHPYYLQMKNGVANDVALLFLKKSLKFSNRIQPIPIAESMTQSLPEGTEVFVVGVGLTEKKKYPYHLKGIYLPITNKQKCNEFLAAIGAKEYTTQICLGNLTIQGKDTCSGDSGGPVTYDGIQYATVSYGLKCGLLGYPAVYANLITLNGWIRQAAKDMGFPLP